MTTHGHIEEDDPTSFARCGLAIPAGDAGRNYVHSLGHRVPVRGKRQNAHREPCNAMMALALLLRTSPELFPAIVAHDQSSQSPDFVLSPETDAKDIGLEITDAGERTFFEWLNHRVPGIVSHVPDPSDGAWIDDEAQRALRDALADAIRRKAGEETRKHAPAAQRYIILYDKMNSGHFIDDEQSRSLLTDAGRASAWPAGIHAAILVRGSRRSMIVEIH